MNPRHIRIGKKGYQALAGQDMAAARLVLEKALADIRDPQRGWLRGGWGESNGPGCLNTRLIATAVDLSAIELSGPLTASMFFEAHPQVRFLFDCALRGVESYEETSDESESVVSRIIRWNDDERRTAQEIELLLRNLIRICQKVERNQTADRIAQYSSTAVEEQAPALQYAYVLRQD